MVGCQVLLVIEPVLVFAKTVSPASGLRDKARPGFIDALLESFDILGRGQCTIVKKVLMDSVCDQHVEVRVATGEPVHQVKGAGLVYRAIRAPQEAISVLHLEAEGLPLSLGAKQPDFTFGVAAHPEQHEVDKVGDINIVIVVSPWIWA